MKKLLSLLFAAILVFPLAACGGNKEKADTTKEDKKVVVDIV